MATMNQGGDATMSQNHPRIISLISNAEEVFQSNSGGLRTFAAVISEKGEEKINLISSPGELIKTIGEPNAKKYGQATYNLKKWTEAGGDALVLRVMPDNAGFAHAFLNIQTRVTSKKVSNVMGALVAHDNIVLKNTLASTSSNMNQKLLEVELNKDRSRDISIDGFVNHLLFLARPIGRGAYYNDLGFRITLNKQFDSTSPSRIYNFEVVEFRDGGIVDVKEGPFIVSLDPDAISGTNDESLYIEDVINKYSKHLRISVNNDEVVSLAGMINKNVNPYSIDVIFGQTRLVSGAEDTFFSNETGKLEDVNIAIHKYNVNGKPVKDLYGNTIINMIDGSDEIEKTIVSIDNQFRDDLTAEYNKSIEVMQASGRDIRSKEYKSKVEVAFTELAELIPDNDSLQLDTVKKIQAKMKNISDRFRAVSITEADLEISILLKDIDLLLNSARGIDIRKVSTSNKTRQLQIALTNGTANSISSTAKKMTLIANIFSEVADIVEYVFNMNNTALIFVTPPAEGFADITALTTAFNTNRELFDKLNDEFESESSKNSIIETLLGHSGISAILGLVDSSMNAVSAAILAKILIVLSGSSGSINTLNDKLLNLKLTKLEGIDDPTKIPLILENVKSNIEAFRNSYYVASFKNVLQSLQSASRLAGGHEGDLREDNPDRNEVIKSLLIKAYSGLLNETVVDKKLLPFNCIFDAGYPVEVKNSITNLADNIRRDFIFIADCQYNSDAESVLVYRRNKFNVSSNLVAIYGQDIVTYDEFTGKDQRFTMPYLMASKIPTLKQTVGLQHPIAGNKRGTIDGFKSINFIPNDTYQDLLYNNRVNYAVQDERRTKLNSQLTSDFKKTPLSDLNNVFTMLSIKKDSEAIVEGYQFELADSDAMRALQQDLNESLNGYITSRACDLVEATVYASDYDLKQHILRVSIKVKFKDIIETVVITLEVTR